MTSGSDIANRRWRWIAFWLSIALCWSAFAFAAEYQVGEYEVKAAFLLNFTKFVEWPEETLSTPGVPFSICVLDYDPFGPLLDRMVGGETASGHRLVVRRVGRQQINNCRLLFVPGQDRGVPQPEPGVLTVGEGEQFLRQGGMVAFVIENRRVRFDINLNAAQKAGLKISSKLLSVARSVDR